MRLAVPLLSSLSSFATFRTATPYAFASALQATHAASTQHHQQITRKHFHSTTTTLNMGKVRTALEEVSKDGEFKRVESGYRNWIKNGTTDKSIFRRRPKELQIMQNSRLTDIIFLHYLQQTPMLNFLLSRVVTICMFRTLVLGHVVL